MSLSRPENVTSGKYKAKKNYVNPLTFAILTMSVIFITFSANPLSLQQVYLQNAFAQDDESQTGIEQRLGQKNLGSGESTNFNCAENMITSASDSIECIPSGPTPPTPLAQPSTIGGTLDGTLTCGVAAVPATAFITNVAGDAVGIVTGFFEINVLGQGTFQLAVNGGTTDGNTYSLSGASGACSGPPFTVIGNCRSGVTVSYGEDGSSGSFTGDVTCTLL